MQYNNKTQKIIYNDVEYNNSMRVVHDRLIDLEHQIKQKDQLIAELKDIVETQKMRGKVYEGKIQNVNKQYNRFQHYKDLLNKNINQIQENLIQKEAKLNELQKQYLEKDKELVYYKEKSIKQQEEIEQYILELKVMSEEIKNLKNRTKEIEGSSNESAGKSFFKRLFNTNDMSETDK